MKPGSTIVTIVPAQNNYIPIMPVSKCGYSYAWKFADVAGLDTVVLLLPDKNSNDVIEVPLKPLERLLRKVKERRAVVAKPLSAKQAKAVKAAAKGTILPGPIPGQDDIFTVYSWDLIYDGFAKDQIRINWKTEQEKAQHSANLELHRRYKRALEDPELLVKMLAELIDMCGKPPGCHEAHLLYLAKLKHQQTFTGAPTRQGVQEELVVQRQLVTLRPKSAYYWFQLAETLESLAAFDDEDPVLLKEAIVNFERCLRADEAFGILDDITRYKAWEMIILIHHLLGDVKGQRAWMERAQSSGYPWRDLMQLPYPAMYHASFTAKPFWDCKDTPYTSVICKLLEDNYKTIKSEVQTALRKPDDGSLISYTGSTNIIVHGNWTQLKIAGDDPKTKALVWNEQMCARGGAFEKTCRILREQNPYASAITGAAKFYLLAPGTRLKAHCGQANLRLFIQMGIIIPKGVKIRVSTEEREWKEGKALILDDSYIHKVKHDGDSLRVTMNLPVWHPDIAHRFMKL